LKTLLEIKRTEILQEASRSIHQKGWLPGLFRGIVNRAREFLQSLIRQTALPPKPVLNMDMAEFRTMQGLMIRVQEKAWESRRLQEEVPKLKAQLAETKGVFKSRERKAIETEIERTEATISAMLEAIPDMLKDDGYPDVQAFIAAYLKAEAVVEEYNRALAEWERKAKACRRPAGKGQDAPPERKHPQPAPADTDGGQAACRGSILGQGTVAFAGIPCHAMQSKYGHGGPYPLALLFCTENRPQKGAGGC